MKTSVLVRRSVQSALIGIAVVSTGLSQESATGPLYRPGTVRTGTSLRAPLSPPAQSGDPNYWTVEPDIKLYHFAAGEGRTVLIVHGGPGRPHLKPWAGLEPLTATYRFHYYDQRGCGQSTRPVDRLQAGNYYQNMLLVDRTLGLGAQIADIERIRRILGEDKLILIGHSFGAFLAALYAGEFPDQVAAMVLIAPADVLTAPNQTGGLFEAVKARLPQDRTTDYSAWLQRYFDFGSIFSKSEADLVALNEEFGRYYRMVTSLPFPEQGKAGGWVTHAIYFSMGRQYDYRPVLRGVSAPVLVIHGAKDVQSEKAGRTYAEAFANSEFHVIAGAEHFPFHTHPSEFASVVTRFLNASLAK